MATLLNASSQKKRCLDRCRKSATLYVIIPVYNRREYTRSCLQALSHQTVDNFKIVVVDDGSTDGTSQMIENEYPEVVLLCGDGNLWWTGSVNIGIKYSVDHGADYVMTLNDDIILQDNFIETMLLPVDENSKALIGGIPIHSVTKEPTYGGKWIDWKTAKYTSVLEKLQPEYRYGLHEVDHLPGRALLIPAEVFKKIGLFDEKNFPQTAADFDFTHRAYKAGYKIYINYDSQFEMYPDSMGGLELRRDRSLKNYYLHLFGIKGKANLKYFMQFSWKHCPKPYLLSYIIIGVSRRVFGYLFEWIVESIKPKNRVKRLS